MAKLPVSALEAFLAVARHGSLRRAAAALGIQPPAVSYQLKALEDQLGVAVFTRTTRSVRLTEAGRALLTRIQPAMSELAEALEEVRGMGRATRGTIRITLPYLAYQLAIGSRLAALQTRYPDIELELSFNEAFVDIVAEGFHAGVRMGDHIHQDMVAVRLTPPLKEVFFASPSYLARHGRPRRPKDLLDHDCIRYRYISTQSFAEWQFHDVEGITSVEVKGTLIVNSATALVDAARDGFGITWLFRPLVEADLRSGALETVLEDYAIERPGYFIYFPKGTARLKLLRAFIEVMKLGSDRTRALLQTHPC